MNKEVLNSLKLGEKAADIQEYYWGKNGSKLVYKVTIYERIKVPFLRVFKREVIDEYVVPFYFETKELAEEYIKYSDQIWFRDLNLDYGFGGYGLFLKNYSNQKNEYYLVNATGVPYDKDQEMLLYKDSVWNGKINPSYRKPYKTKSIYFTEIFKLEELAAKEGTTGQTFSYKLI